MILKVLPYLLIILPIIGFFVDTNTPQWQAHNGMQEILLFLMIIPWWGKIISILIGLGWIVGNAESNKTQNN